MIRYAIRRVLWGFVVLFILLLFVFVLFGPVLQGQKGLSAAAVMCGPRCTPTMIANSEHFLGLDKPWYVQFGSYTKRLILGPSDEDYERLCPKRDGVFIDKGECVGHFGRTFIRSRSVDRVITEALPVTVSIALAAAFVWILLSVPIGVICALRRGSVFDRSMMVLVLWGQALPIYYFGLLAIYFLAYFPNSQQFFNWFGVRLEIFPLGEYVPLTESPFQWARHLILPACTLALQFAALYVRMIRSNMLGVMAEDYIRTARAKGVSPRRVTIRHGLRNALLPIVTMFGMDVGGLLGGAILTEYTFSMQGIGRQSVIGVGDLDVPLTAGIVLLGGTAIVVANIVVDLVYATLDPRIRLG